ncbi:DEAD/DEAH box helicase [Rhodoferax sp. U11-2br]|uniref:DEAD/DEAH box helicase n=1 Tax=Rhodoferax sp. U11-2br TaxID=2838878 RepID=UPI001BED371B|nr:DEAD/DEAH box helicase [Rhodoferax sp. U11-2br]MBT3066292.1 DEAD/DEAH box helicase [Rhodoferax sp. U11-2br]
MPHTGAPQGLWLDLASLAQRAGAAVYGRALDLYRNQKVQSLSITPVQKHWLLEGEVQGTQHEPYQVEVELSLGTGGQLRTWDSDCTCPVGYQCKHAVALMIKAAYRGKLLLENSNSADAASTPEQREAQRQAEVARQQAAEQLESDNQLIRWLGELARTASHTTSALPTPPKPSRSGAPADRPEQFLYLLSVLNPQGPSPQLSLEVVTAYPKVVGGWSRAKAMKFQPERGQPIYDQASDTDHDVLQLMRAMPGSSVQYYYSYSARNKITPEGKYGVQILEKAASTGRLYVLVPPSQPGAPVVWGEPLTLSWEWYEVGQSINHRAGWALRAKLGDGQAKLCLNNPPLYLDSVNGRCGLVDLQGMSLGQIAVLLKTPPLKAESLKKYQPELMAQLGPVPPPPVLEQLPTLKNITPKACLYLHAVPPDLVRIEGLMLMHLSFDYAGYRGWWVGQGNTVLVDGPQGRVMLQRDPQTELEAIVRLRDWGFASQGHGGFGIPGNTSQQRWLQLVDSDYAPLREAGFELKLDDSLTHWISHANALDVNIQAQGDDEATSPWFNLSLGMEINGQRHNILPLLPTLISTAAMSPRDALTDLPDLPPFVYLPKPEGGFIRLPTDNLKPWLGALLELVGDHEHDFTGESLKLSRLDAMRTTAALGEGAVWDGAQQLRELVQRLSGRTELPQVAIPASVQATLRPYQQQGVNWLQFLREYGLAGILADDMGLGKTLQTLAHIQIEKDAGRLTSPALIIAPVSLMGNWRREAERFCPGLRCLVIHGADRHEVSGSTHDHDIVIAPYSLLPRDREGWLQGQWHLVVLDEAQNIKNAATQAAQVVAELNTRHRLCLSGTPMENNLGELWSLFHFLMPGFLGSQKRFTELFRNPIEKQGDPEALQQLRARVTPFMLRRTKALVAHELPPKVETVMRVELSGKQADLYETIRLGMEKTVREALSTKGLAKSQITILDALLKLRQVCCDPHLLKLDAAKKVKTSAKLDQLMELLPEMLAEGRRILLFSQFTSMLTLIEAELKQRGLKWVKLTGQSQKRDEIIHQFTSGAVPLFLISLKAGGTGLNLPQADTVIHFDPWWNPAVEAQATDRAHRIGQTQSVWVVKLVAQGTIEERILALQERKASLADSMYSGSVGRKEPLFSESDLAELLKPLAG